MDHQTCRLHASLIINTQNKDDQNSISQAFSQISQSLSKESNKDNSIYNIVTNRPQTPGEKANDDNNMDKL